MLEHICVFNNKIFIPLLNNVDSYVLVYSYNTSRNAKNLHNFVEDLRVKLPITNPPDVSDVYFDVVDNYVSGFKNLVVFVLFKLDSPKMYCYTENITGDSHFQLIQCGWPRNIQVIPNVNSLFTGGPISVLVTLEMLFVFSIVHNTKKTYCFRTDQFYNASNVRILQSTCTSSLPGLLCKVFIVLLFSGPLDNKLYILSFTLDTESGIFSENYTHLQTYLFFPGQYQKELTVLRICNFEAAGDSKSNCWDETLSILCASQKCLVFCKGALKYCCDIPFPDATSIRIKYDTYFPFSDHIEIILHSKQNGICYIKNKRNENIEVVHYWKDTVAALIGDFLLDTSEQLLLLKSISLNLWQNDCILVDLSFPSSVTPVGQSSVPDEYLGNAMLGLQKKIQAAKVTIAEKECEISQKMAATFHSLHNLNEHVAKDHHPHYEHIASFQDSLVDIILSKDENAKSESRTEKSCMGMEILEHWTTLLMDHWLLCWTLSNKSRVITNPSTIVSIQGIQLQCLQKYFVHTSSVLCTENKCNRQINQGEKFSIVVALGIPAFQKEKTTADVIITWYDGTSGQFDNEFLLTETEKTLPQHQLSTTACLSLSEVFCWQTVKSGSKNGELSALNVLHHRTVLCITTLNHKLVDVAELLTVNDNEINKLSPHNSNCLIFENEKSPLFGVQISLTSVDQKHLEMEVFVRNDEQILLLVQWLYFSLPSDIIIIPCEYMQKEALEMKKRIVCAMKEEIDLLSSSLKTHNVKPSLEKAVPTLSSFPDIGVVIIPKERFMRIRSALAKKEIITDSIARNLQTCKI